MIHHHFTIALLFVCGCQISLAEDSALSPVTRRLQSVFLNAGEEEQKTPAPAPEAQAAFPIVIWVHESAFQVNSNNKVNIVAPVDTMIVGRRAIGTSRTTGTIKVQCVPERDSSSLLVTFTGQTNSKSAGQSAPA